MGVVNSLILISVLTLLIVLIELIGVAMGVKIVMDDIHKRLGLKQHSYRFTMILLEKMQENSMRWIARERGYESVEELRRDTQKE